MVGCGGHGDGRSDGAPGDGGGDGGGGWWWQW